MRHMLFLALLLQSDSMAIPRVEHHVESHQETKTTDNVTVACPKGYEGHFVDRGIGFDWMSRGDDYGNSVGAFGIGSEETPGYTICFKKEFMDQVRKDPELLRARPPTPRPW